MVKYLKPNDLASRENFVEVSTQSGATTKDMLDYIKPVVRKKISTVTIHTGANDLTNGVKTRNKVKKLIHYIRENDKDKNIQIGFLVYVTGLEKKTNNGRLKNYCSGKWFIFADNSAINESCLSEYFDQQHKIVI